MTKFITYKRCFCKRLDGRWEWETPVWLTKVGIFADCVIKSTVGKIFNTQEDAEKDMKKVFKKLRIKINE